MEGDGYFLELNTFNSSLLVTPQSQGRDANIFIFYYSVNNTVYGRGIPLFKSLVVSLGLPCTFILSLLHL